MQFMGHVAVLVLCLVPTGTRAGHLSSTAAFKARSSAQAVEGTGQLTAVYTDVWVPFLMDVGGHPHGGAVCMTLVCS
jgi:hypothetical protein